jgi:hypothetical protein
MPCASVDDAGLHQIGDPVADRPRMDAETLLAAERVGHRLGNRAEANLDSRVVGDQAIRNKYIPGLSLNRIIFRSGPQSWASIPSRSVTMKSR